MANPMHTVPVDVEMRVERSSAARLRDTAQGTGEPPNSTHRWLKVRFAVDRVKARLLVVDVADGTVLKTLPLNSLEDVTLLDPFELFEQYAFRLTFIGSRDSSRSVGPRTLTFRNATMEDFHRCVEPLEEMIETNKFERHLLRQEAERREKKTVEVMEQWSDSWSVSSEHTVDTRAYRSSTTSNGPSNPLEDNPKKSVQFR
jgi:hypothetical protein